MRFATRPRSAADNQQRRGFTLIELVIALSIMSILMIGMGGAIMIATRSIDDSGGPATTLRTSLEITDEITRDLHFAIAFSERTPTAVTMSVPDRSGDGVPESIRYAWVDAPDPGRLIRQYNGGPEVVIAESVTHFDLEYLYQTVRGVPIVITGPPVLLVAPDADSLTSQCLARIALLESWGYTVMAISDDATQAEFDSAVAISDAAYVCEEINELSLGTKLRNATIGVVNEKIQMHDEFGFGKNYGVPTNRQEITITGTTHFVTEPFATGLLTICSSTQPLAYFASQFAPDLQNLATVVSGVGPFDDKPSLVVLETGATLEDGGTAAGRRVQLPWGNAGFDIDALNDDGRTIMQRAVQWAAVPTGGPVVPDANFGFETEFPTPVSNVDGRQIATQVTLPDDGTITRITAFVGGSSKDVRYAIYSDDGGEPDALLLETTPVATTGPDSWVDASVSPTWLPAGTYWLALSFDRFQHHYHQEPIGQVRYRNHDAEANGFLDTWGPSDDSFSIKISIYATFTPD